MRAEETAASGAATAGEPAPSSATPEPDAEAAPPTPYERLSAEIIGDALLAEQVPSFQPPPVLAPGLPAQVRAREKAGLSLTATFLVSSAEWGRSDRFVGGGSGLELRLNFHRPSGWIWSATLTQAKTDLFSEVDGVPASVQRYLLGVGRNLVRLGPLQIRPGGGLALNQVDIEKEPGELDIEGPGVYGEIQSAVALGRVFRLGASARLIYWQGEDGFGNKGDEFSVATGLYLTARF